MACLFQTSLVNDTITLGYHTQIVVFRQNYCFKKIKSKQKENYYVTEHILESFQTSRFIYSMLMVYGYPYYEVLCFDQDIITFSLIKFLLQKMEYF